MALLLYRIYAIDIENDSGLFRPGKNMFNK